MDRREFINTLAAANVGAATALQAKKQETPNQPAPADAPNVLWICTDQQRWDTIHALGNKHIRTPNIDRLCREGVAFTHAHCQNPICTPSRASFLTGMYPRYLSACKNGTADWANESPLVTKTLAGAGYDCGLAGKFHLTAAHNRIEPRLADGYRVFHWSHHPHDSWPEGHAYKDWLTEQGHEYGPLKKKSGGGIPAEFHQTKWCADRAIDFMLEKRSSPWLFSYNCFDPHPPLDPPKKYLDRMDIKNLPLPDWTDEDLKEEGRLAKAGVNFQSTAKSRTSKKARTDLAKYWAMIELIDDHVGRMVEALEESGQRDNTVIIFTSDHGHMIGDHGLTAKGCRFYEGLVRVPLIMSCPGRFKKGIKSDALVELTDLTPTLLELAGRSVPEAMHGKSLLPILTGSANPDDHREFVRCTYTETLQGAPSWGTMIRDRRYKLCNYHGTGLGQLFDMKEDPNEHRNLWDSPAHAEIKAKLMVKSFDAEAMTADSGAPRIGRY
ncbi:MAG: sulfatase [Verrucomicrobiales bacterium]|mgnify:CR=1 FL=1|nr:sulfatase [Verrucomicrobiales bacterium]|tara:strand:- start:1196 stop:2683 length:1488 start_codon:yes stop_codon:yes gene_type:complete